MAQRSEFTAPQPYAYSYASPLRWIISHIWRYWYFALATFGCFLAGWLCYTQSTVLVGDAANALLDPARRGAVLGIALAILALRLIDGVVFLLGSFAAENVAARVEADARQELYANLLGKSQTFHDRQRVGDIMARATDDTNQLSNMIVPGSTLLFETVMGLTVPLAYIASVSLELALVPLLFELVYLLLLGGYMRRLGRVVQGQREQFGVMNAGLEETISGIEVVKASAREAFERAKFRHNARQFRDLFVQQGQVEASYLPLLVYGAAVGLTFLHAVLAYRAGRVDLGQIIAVMGLVGLVRFPTFISVTAFSLVQSGLAGARRIIQIVQSDTELDQNSGGLRQPMRGAISFEGVSFGYGGRPLLEDVSFEIQPGQTVAIVGQTGAGKTTLTQLLNRTYDVTAGRVLVDGVDVREWNLDSLRSQISKIEQDIFLFSRTIAENIAFGAPEATREQVEQAARAAQAHDFITGFADGYDTVVGERGVTLSGGQRQRIALARAFLSDPRVLILDDSTSAIDSATEDQIQRAIRQAQVGRTTLLITHRLAQIRWADLILVLEHGRVVAQGSHADLLRTSPHYRRIFARYDAALPPLDPADRAGALVQEPAPLPQAH